MELSSGNISSQAKYDVHFAEGKLVAKVVYDASMLDGSVELKLDADAVLDALAKAIPGTIDDAILTVVKAALKK